MDRYYWESVALMGPAIVFAMFAIVEMLGILVHYKNATLRDWDTVKGCVLSLMLIGFGMLATAGIWRLSLCW